MTSEKTTYLQRKAAGVCVRCGIKDAKRGYVQCAECIRLDRDASTCRKARLAAEGRCTRCGRPKEDAQFATCRRCRKTMWLVNMDGMTWKEARKAVDGEE